jgi:sporulation protein YabP
MWQRGRALPHYFSIGNYGLIFCSIHSYGIETGECAKKEERKLEHNYQKSSSQHRLIILNRESMDVTGVLHVDSFDDEEVILETEQGILAIRGEELHIKQLNLEKGELAIEGLILELAYSDDKRFRDRGKGLFERLFK